MIFTSENHWLIASLVTQKLSFAVTRALSFISHLLQNVKPTYSAVPIGPQVRDNTTHSSPIHHNFKTHKILSSINMHLFDWSFYYFAQSIAVIPPSSASNFKTIHQLRKQLWTWKNVHDLHSKRDFGPINLLAILLLYQGLSVPQNVLFLQDNRKMPLAPKKQGTISHRVYELITEILRKSFLF